MDENCIFENLTKEDENATTELLRNLCRFDDYREIVLRALGLDAFQIDFEDIVTQEHIPKKGKIPDIKIEKENEFRIYIENKKDSRLSKSQIETYPDVLKKLKQKVKMIYLVPENHKDIDKIKALKNKHKFVSLVTWENFINELEKYNKDKHSEIMDESIKYFNVVLDMIPKIEFSEEDITFMTDFKKLRKAINPLAKEMELFSNIIVKLQKELNPNSYRKTPQLTFEWDAFGYYFCKYCYLGYSFLLLEEKSEKKDYVLSLALHKEGVKEGKIKDYKQYPFIFDDYAYYHFKIDPDMFREEAGELLFNFCRDILKELLDDKK